MNGVAGLKMNCNNMDGSAWKSSLQEGGGSHLAPPAPSIKASWVAPDFYDHSSLVACTRCAQGNYMSYGGGVLGQGSNNILDEEVMQELQYHMEEEDDMSMEMEMKMMKKRKLTREQVGQLEASFEVDKKLDAEKKQRLATQLGLEPRQVAVWFQNRRARSKTKQLEMDFVSLKAEYDRVLVQHQTLQDEISRLVMQLQAKNLEAKINSCNEDSTSSTDSHNGDLISESTTLHIRMGSPTKDREDFTYNFNQESGKSKEEISRLQDLAKPSITSYDWESYDNGFWVFD